jgi:aryl-alcohol dehydrogenase-like predicted oxidoreductase
MTFGDDWGWGAVKDEERKVYDAFRDAGGNFVDTPNIYTNGTSEPFLGEFMKDHRQSVVLATKYTNAHPGEIRRSMAQVALAWLRYRPVPVMPIIGARKLSQLQSRELRPDPLSEPFKDA